MPRTQITVTGSRNGTDSICAIVPGMTLSVRWHGGHGLHLYDISSAGKRGRPGQVGREVQYRTVGDFARDALSRSEARREVKEWAAWILSGDPAALEFY